jgi:predicted nucleotidyltransferase
MENIQTAIQHAYDARPAEFKNSILDALNDKIQNHIEVKRMELAGSIFRDDDEEQQSNDSETEFQSSSEGNVDEDI